MKKTLFLLYILSFTIPLFAQENYWQQEVNFTINVSLNDKEHTLDAFEKIEYINNSPDTLTFIWFHIWPNAYKNDRTAFSEQLLQTRRTDFYFAKPNQKGYINQLDFTADGATAQSMPDSLNIDVIKVLLSKPLPPGKKVILTTPFKVKLPYNFSRSGHIGNNYEVAQWFPKPAVYDSKGWHPMPYVDQGEFYSEFGKFDVQITVPAAYLVAATGVLQDAETLKELKENRPHTVEGQTKTWHYIQENIHDFAWFASKDLMVKYDTVVLPSKKVVDVFCYYRTGSKIWTESMNYAKDGLRKYSSWLGDYPYSVATVVEGSKNENIGGMEYPTITVVDIVRGVKELDITIVHELGHNWFYAALASNERAHPWMDEGMNTFYQKRYQLEKYGSYSLLKDVPFSGKVPDDEESVVFETMAKLKKDQPIETASEKFTSLNYGLTPYYKASSWLKKREASLGREAFDKVMQHYYNNWKFKHPYPHNFKTSIEKTTGKNVDDLFSQLNTTGSLWPAQKKTIKPSFLSNLKQTDKYNYINFAPAVGYNNYDKGMIGGLIHNYQLPLNKLQFIGGVLYGTGSKKVNGFGRTSYNIYQRNYHASAALSYISYTQNDFVTDDNVKLTQGIKRWVPSLKVTLFDKDPLSTRRLTMQWKTFLLNEGALQFKTVTSPTDTFDVVSTVTSNSYINRLSLEVSDTRVLFPYSVALSADQGKDFIRAGITGKYYFNYPDGKTGMEARFFAGKFFYLKPKTVLNRFKNDRYLLNMSAPKGYEDYTYSDYFIGRNEFEGWQSQQIMERDGFFKVNTELFNDKVGKTDDWLMSLNLSSGLPDNINPLSVLPIKVPLKLFLDVGTYAEAWRDNPATGRFIYDAGIQLPLFGSLVNVYVPIIYSKVYSNYYKYVLTEKRFLKTIAFNINLQKLQAKELLKGVPL